MVIKSKDFPNSSSGLANGECSEEQADIALVYKTKRRPPMTTTRSSNRTAVCYDAATSLTTIDASLGTGGIPLPHSVRASMEGVFGADLSSIRIHEGYEAAALGARAFAYGEHIYFSPGGFQPHTFDGDWLLGHEIAHVMQQRSGVAREMRSRSEWMVLDSPILEDEANQCGRLAAFGHVLPDTLLSRNVSPFSVPVIQRVKTHIGMTSGLELIQIIDEAVDIMINNRSINPYSNVGRNNWQNRHMTDPRNWLFANGRLALTGQNNATHWLPCWLRFNAPHNTQQPIFIEVSGNNNDVWSERLHFPMFYKTDLNYQQVADAFATELGTFTDAQIVEHILNCLMGRPYGHGMSRKQACFIAGIVGLLFGVEASRFKSSIATSLMLLDLIRWGKCYGRNGTKPFTLAHAFHATDAAGQDLHWDVPNLRDQSQWYGGKYPLAVHGTGSGNMRAYQDMVAGGGPSEHVQILTQRHAVPRRTITIFVHWLEAHHSDAEIANMTAGKARLKLISRLNQAFVSHVIPPAFTFSPRTTTGVHTNAIVQHRQVIWYDTGRYYHRDWQCKLIQGQYRANPYNPHVNPQQLYLNEFSVTPGVLHRYNARQWLSPPEQRAVQKHMDAIATLNKSGTCWIGNAGDAMAAGKAVCPKCGHL
jgi:hypothetical protein